MVKSLGARIAGTGAYVPVEVLDNEYFARYLDTSPEWIIPRTGIRTRHRAGANETTAGMACEASKKAIADAGLTPADIDHVICCTVSGDYLLPATACVLQDMLGINGVPAWDLHAACSGLVYGMVMAGSLISSGMYKNVLVVGAETLTRFTDYEDRSTCILFGDAAAAVVVQPSSDASRGVLYYELGSDGSAAKHIWIPAGGSAEPSSIKTVNERLHFMRMRGRELYKYAVTKMEEIIDRAIERSGIKADELKLVIPHQSNFRIIEATRSRLGLAEHKVAVNIDRYGNTSAASIGLALDEARRTGQVAEGDLVMLVGVGAGITWGVVVVRL